MMEWITLILENLPALLECFDKDGEEATLRRLRRLGPREEFRLWRTLAKQGIPMRERREKIREVRSALAEASDEELLGLIESAKEFAAAGAQLDDE